MFSPRNLDTDGTSEQFRLAVLLGLASIPATVWLNWILTPNTLPRGSEVSALLIASVIAGYAYHPRPATSSRAGTITGFVGGLPVVFWQSAIGFSDAWNSPLVIDAVGESASRFVVAGGFALVSVIVLLVIVLLVGSVGGSIGGWLNERLHSPPLFGSTG
jgi:Family of unknown function (DUF5518)